MTVTRVVWRREDEPGHEHASLVEDDGGLVLRGVAVLAWRSQPCRLDYEVRCDPSWATRSARVTGSVGTREIDARVESASGGGSAFGTLPARIALNSSFAADSSCTDTAVKAT